MQTETYDIAIVGAGPGGYVAAIRAAQLGFKTVIIEKQHLGGVCLNWGCIPTKALLKSAEVYRTLKAAETFGFEVKEITVDLPKIIARSRKMADKLAKGVQYLLKKNAVTVISATATLLKPGTLVLHSNNESIEINAKHIILATGARPKEIGNIKPDKKFIWTAKEAMTPTELPTSLLIIGSGAIGIEFASFYHALGVEVTVIELLDRVLPQEDSEISKLALQMFKQQGMAIFTETTVIALDTEVNSVCAKLQSQDGSTQELRVERVILAVGITGNIEELGLEQLDVKTERGHILVDEWSQTNVAGIYAIGDVTAPPWLAHKAMHEGVICVEKIAGLDNIKPLNPQHIPSCTYSYPQIASIGLTESAALAAGHNVRVGRFNLMASGKALAIGENSGLIKTIFDQHTGELLGAHMIGPEVTELIQGFGIAQSLEATEVELLSTVFAHPTLSEAMHESVLDAYERGLHQ